MALVRGKRTKRMPWSAATDGRVGLPLSSCNLTALSRFDGDGGSDARQYLEWTRIGGKRHRRCLPLHRRLGIDLKAALIRWSQWRRRVRVRSHGLSQPILLLSSRAWRPRYLHVQAPFRPESASMPTSRTAVRVSTLPRPRRSRLRSSQPAGCQRPSSCRARRCWPRRGRSPSNTRGRSPAVVQAGRASRR